MQNAIPALEVAQEITDKYRKREDICLKENPASANIQAAQISYGDENAARWGHDDQD